MSPGHQAGAHSFDQEPTVWKRREDLVVLLDVKLVYGLIALIGLSFVVFWVTGSPATRVQSDPGPVEVPQGVYDPVRAGESPPAGFRQLLGRDAILPVYNPTFRSAITTDWDDDALVIGLELDGEAKAYPVSFLNRREMVIDWIAGSPVLVTW